MQQGSTPYLRGAEDPTYLRLKGDSTLHLAMIGATALGWMLVLRSHYRMWVGAKN